MAAAGRRASERITCGRAETGDAATRRSWVAARLPRRVPEADVPRSAPSSIRAPSRSGPYACTTRIANYSGARMPTVIAQ
jgi:hypothetical protein